MWVHIQEIQPFQVKARQIRDDTQAIWTHFRFQREIWQSQTQILNDYLRLQITHLREISILNNVARRDNNKNREVHSKWKRVCVKHHADNIYTPQERCDYGRQSLHFTRCVLLSGLSKSGNQMNNEPTHVSLFFFRVRTISAQHVYSNFFFTYL